MKVTIIIPSYERREQLLRSLGYWQKYPINLIVLDGSASPTLQTEDISHFSRVTYLHLARSFEERLNIGASMVRTPYAMFLSDDEFVLYSGLQDACQVLDSDPEVSAVLGGTLIFYTFKGQMVAAPCYASAAELNINSSLPIERYRQRVDVPGNIIFYSLTRANILQLAGQFIAERKYSCLYISEYQVEGIFCAAGTVKVLPRVFWLRSLDTPPVAFKGCDRHITAPEWFDDVSNAAEIAHLSDSADRFFSMTSGDKPKITGKEFLFEVNRSARGYEVEASLTLLLRQLFQSLPEWLRDFVRNLRRLMRSSAPQGFKQLPQLITELSGQMSVDQNELMRVKKLVENR